MQTEIRSLFRNRDTPHEPLTTAEVADTLDHPAEDVLPALETLVDEGMLQTRELAEGPRLWWASFSASVSESVDSGLPEQLPEDLRKRLDLFDNVQDIASVGAWEYDVEADEGWWTEEVSRIHGLPPDHVPHPEESLEFYHPEDRERVREMFQQALEQKEPYDIEARLVDADGEVHWVRTRGEVDVEDGDAVRLYGTLQDITGRKEIEQELRRVQRATEAAQSEWC